MKKWWVIVQFFLLCLVSVLFFSKNAWAEEQDQMITLNVHEINPIDEKIKDGTPMVGVNVSVYNLTKDYQEEKNNEGFDIKSFTEKWTNKALFRNQSLGEPLATEQTNCNGICKFNVPLLIAQNYGVYMITANNSQLKGQGIVLPAIVLFPIISTKTGKLMNPVEVYPQYLDRKNVRLQQFEQINLIEKNSEIPTIKNSYQIDGLKPILVFIGGLLLLILVIDFV